MTDIPPNVTAIWLAVIAAVSGLIVSIFGWIQARDTHKAVNSRMDEMLKLTRESSKAEGIKEQKELTEGG